MAEWTLINTENWPRYEHFRHFMEDSPCNVWLTDDIDVTSIHSACNKSGRSFYIAMLYTVSRVINSHDEFKLRAVDSPKFERLMPAVWDRVDPVHNVFHEESKTYTSTFTVYDHDFEVFYRHCAEDIERARRLKTMSVPAGENTFEASCIPWRHFTSVGASIESIPLSPIVTWGKFAECDGRLMMPLSIQINHAAADGFHLARFLCEVEALSATLAEEI
ncbi:MAG: hypothetical protein E7628_07725 [Ruminococcaceae bacterium]|nr:hypothetical protein [Oscillospiraceae bacterium]